MDKEMKELEKALKDIKGTYGDESIKYMNEVAHDIDCIPTGSLSLDYALGIGGVPTGRIIEIFGPESSGKTTLAAHVLSEAQKKFPNKAVAIIDAEHSIDQKYLSNENGIDLDMSRCLISQPDYGEQGLNMANKLASTGNVSVILIDSVSALIPKAELESEIGDQKMGLQARMMSQALRFLPGTAKKTGTTVIFINQIRHKIGVMFGSPETTSGGNSLKFYCSVRIRCNSFGKAQEEDGMPVSQQIRARVYKNKVAPPGTQAEYKISFGKGIDKEEDLLKVATELEVIDKRGSWYSYDDTKIGQGTINACQFMRDNPGLLEEVKNICKEKLKDGLQ